MQIQAVLLTVDEIRGLAPESHKSSHDLHNEARAWLNKIADEISHDRHVALDMTLRWPQWSAWLATQSKATSFQSNVTGFTLSSIPNTKDPNRGGRPRVDYVVHLADGSNWRFHPGTTMKNSAEPTHTPASDATEHAVRTVNNENPWTLQRARHVPQGDRMGKDTMWERVAALLRDMGHAWVNDLDITDGAVIPWWLWVGNLGHHTDAIIGEGIVRAFLSRRQKAEVVFTFIHGDNSYTYVTLGQRLDGQLYTCYPM